MRGIVEPWMIGALKKKGNTVIGITRMRRYGKEAYIQAFADLGYDVTIREGYDDGGCVIGPTGNVRTKRVPHYIVEVVRSNSR